MTPGFHTKICSKCKIEQHLYFFHLDPRTLTYESRCKECRSDDKEENRKIKIKPPDDGSIRFCRICGENKSMNEFRFHRKNGYTRICVLCERKKNLEYITKTKYGISLVKRDEILASQKNRCAICTIEFNNTNLRSCMDHNASNGKVRGLLCIGCNILIGVHQENCETLRAAGFNRHAEYLEYYERVHDTKLMKGE